MGPRENSNTPKRGDDGRRPPGEQTAGEAAREAGDGSGSAAGPGAGDAGTAAGTPEAATRAATESAAESAAARAAEAAAEAAARDERTATPGRTAAGRVRGRRADGLRLVPDPTPELPTPSVPPPLVSAEPSDSPEPSQPSEPSVSSGPHDFSGPSGPSSDPRVLAVRRFKEFGRRLRALRLGGSVVLLAVALTAGSVAVGELRDDGPGTAVAAAAPGVLSPAALNGGDLEANIKALQAHLRGQPKDFGGWATLGLAYVEQARTKGDPSRYPQAERALRRSLDLRPGNEQALTGRAALAAARHRFDEALGYADRVLKENPYSERALCSRIDALVELGRYAEASKAADTADDRRPGIPVFTRYAYVRELRGDVRTARRVLEQALATAATPGDIAYVAAQLGQLAWNQGDYATALTDYARALAADENYLPALEGRARVLAARGERATAVAAMEQVVARFPLPGPLVELGELYEERGGEGDRARAADQYALVDAWTALARAGGVNADLDTALAAADHGDRASALRAARAEYARRRTVHTADALAWALHMGGRDAEALRYTREAAATGYRNALFLYHRGTIERATGHEQDGLASLRAALRLNPGFSTLGARQARAALEDAK
ncbi:tetratricopeptide repeat protein [Streptomyces griseoviridis]